MTLSLLEVLLLANAPIEGDKPNKSNLALEAKTKLGDPTLEVRVIMPTIDNLVTKGYLDKGSNFVFTITNKGQKILKSSVKELQDIVWDLPR